MNEEIKKYFEYFYFKICGRKKKVYSAKEDQAVTTLASLLVSKYKTVGDNFLWTYFVFQFSFWEGREINNYNGLINLNNIIGIKSFKRFENRKQEYDWRTAQSSIITKYTLLSSDLVSSQTIKGRYTDIELKTKLMRLNTPEGFINCIDLTTLYNPKHECCLACIFIDDCKALLKNNYPTVFSKRKIV